MLLVHGHGMEFKLDYEHTLTSLNIMNRSLEEIPLSPENMPSNSSPKSGLSAPVE